MPPQRFSRPFSILILTCIGLSFSLGHIAARMGFDMDLGVISAVIFRSGLVVLALSIFLFWRRQSIAIPRTLRPWQLLLGLLLTIQSIGLYIAVASIPVGIALLFMHTFAILLALITWALGGPAPTRTGFWLMLLCLFGLFLSLDVPHLLEQDNAARQVWAFGVGAAVTGALAFAFGLWITEHKLSTLSGAVRSFYATVVIMLGASGIGKSGVFEHGLAAPAEPIGWLYVFLLSALYGLGFVTLFVLTPRLNMAQNAPALHIEPIASLVMGWLILDQRLSLIQVAGGICVVTGIMLLALQRQQAQATAAPKEP
ncbi:MAG TPA: DMT family transporter [Paenalcaligenes sp.]|nr:DMT family transporter [Paenalcaligenes sp.]